ncbi:uncharacterized protein VTP21DRAFT_8238 [Calcarisporiella thermophila]|uniref:uncharacterized protein n=1 Tax=Calcarisporiella thermophila TaxID=911321 RepID=UPI003743DB09
MFCAISGEAPEHPVISKKSGQIFERRLILKYIAENGQDPITHEELTEEDLVDVKTSQKGAQPRPPNLTSVPALLSTFHDEWDKLMLETFKLKQEHAQLRQELSQALYQYDAATRVIARLMKERDEAREALANLQANSS